MRTSSNDVYARALDSARVHATDERMQRPPQQTMDCCSPDTMACPTSYELCPSPAGDDDDDDAKVWNDGLPLERLLLHHQTRLFCFVGHTRT